MMIEEKLLQRINQRITITENTLTKTYPLLKEPRILLTVLDNLYLIVNDIITYKIENKYRLLEREKKNEIYKKKFKKNL
ncbi:MAG: hypothetical protein ACMXX8_01880, partial [Candidatus Woesearchaeota archaeon]